MNITAEIVEILSSLIPQIEFPAELTIGEELKLSFTRSPQIKTSITNERIIEVWCNYEGAAMIVSDRILDNAQEFSDRGIEEAWIYFGGRKTKLYL